MSKILKNKVLVVVLVVALALLGTVCFAALQWSYLVDCTYGFEETKIGILRKDGVACLGSTEVDPPNYAKVVVFLKTLDEDGDWVTVTAWEDFDSYYAVVDVEYEVDPGTYKIETTHRAYAPDDLTLPVETHYMESDPVTIY